MNTKLEEIMHKIGQIGTAWAIQNHEFNNRTNNLEDSYGYAVYYKGAIQGEPFLTAKKATQSKNGKSGHEEASNFLKSYNADPSGWAVVVCAGMEYADFVQFYYDLDVLQGSELIAKQAADELFKNIQWKSQ